MDVFTGKAAVAAMLLRTRVLERISLTAREDGTIILLGQLSRSPRWVAFSFILAPDNQIQWRGIASGTGEVLDDPVNATEGLKIPVRIGDQQDILTLDDASFKPFPQGCSEM